MTVKTYLVEGILPPYRKYSEVVEVTTPLTELAVDQPQYLRELGEQYLAEFGTVFEMEQVTDVEFFRQKRTGIIHTGLSFDYDGKLYYVPKFALKRFLTRLFGSESYATLIKMPSLARDLCLESMFLTGGKKEFQLLHNKSSEVFGVASPAYTFIPTIDTAIKLESLVADQLPDAEYSYKFSPQYGFRGFIFDKEKTALREVGDVRKMLKFTNKHTGWDAFRCDTGLERLDCTNGMTSKENYPGVRIIHLGDDSESLTKTVRQELVKQIEAIELMFKDLEYSTEIFVHAERAKAFVKAIPNLPRKIQDYLERSLDARIHGGYIRLYDIQYVLSDIASNRLTKPQHSTLSDKLQDLAGCSIDPEIFDRIVEEQERKEESNENEEEFHNVEVA